ncbi:stage IV sporulation protein A [Candidatus Epulonipiscium fishelsonii]|uniref:Stage IV sporulation protein A n=1 Tax=Candidatus Epulonipiscium fishelsonii TaxID=77094 RepID=A0ACC8XHR7_9FIRM|nr:stage IV sporulation protein A [Epulopiscium sp. SCG-D08WGA-EpuloA1]OON91338.1 MAG: stage IV sporulation protein A [Epulopiscium sp. AS2M-Bin002]
MEHYDIYRDISERTDGDIYLGIVGPVRTGKSTFIKRFMESLVIPNIQNEYSKERAQDELPQSGGGSIITTTEPKFIPNEAVSITIGGDFEVNVRLIDCVGYVIPDAEGYMYSDNTPRMVKTPWYSEEIPFTQAAEIGTRKVINDHSTIGVVITTDGSITGISRSSYIDAEERSVNELKKLGKPFVVLYNTKKPFDQEVIGDTSALAEKYNVPVIPIDIAQMKMEDINQILERVLYEFPLNEIQFMLPKWSETLDNEHWFKKSWINAIREYIYPLENIRQVKETLDKFKDLEHIKNIYLEKIQLGDGILKVDVHTDDDLFYKILSETTGMEINDDHELMELIKELAVIKKDYDKVASALNDVKRKGYGVVKPLLEESTLEQPEIIKKGNNFGIKLRASAPSYHIIRADIQTEVVPTVGSDKQSEEFINSLISIFEEDPAQIWNSQIFGRSVYSMLEEGMQNKLYRMPEDAQEKLQETLQKIINEGTGGLICIIL